MYNTLNYGVLFYSGKNPQMISDFLNLECISLNNLVLGTLCRARMLDAKISHCCCGSLLHYTHRNMWCLQHQIRRQHVMYAILGILQGSKHFNDWQEIGLREISHKNMLRQIFKLLRNECSTWMVSFILLAWSMAQV